MINIAKIKYNEPIYYIPVYGGSTRASILKLFTEDIALVKPFSTKNDFKPFPTPIMHIYNNVGDASRGRRNWENYMRKRKRDKKNGKQK